MKFPFIPISYIIADVKAELKKMDLAGEIIDEDCKNYIVEVMREIGGANYPDDHCVLFIKNNVAQLPENFYVIDRLWLCSESNNIESARVWFSREGKTYIPDGLIFPGDATTGTQYNKYANVTRASLKTHATYIIRHPRQFRCSLDTAIVGINYVGLPMDERGQVLIQDEINTIKAAKAYTKKMILSERFYGGQLPQYIWNDLKNDHAVAVDQAQAIFKFPDPADDEARGYNQDNRYNAFNLE